MEHSIRHLNYMETIGWQTAGQKIPAHKSGDIGLISINYTEMQIESSPRCWLSVKVNAKIDFVHLDICTDILGFCGDPF